MSSRLLILALTLVAVVIGGVNLSLTAPDAVRAVNSHLDDQLARVAKALPVALEEAAERSMGLVSEVAQSPEMKSALASVSADTAPDQNLLDQVLQVADASAQRRGDKEIRGLAVVATGAGAAIFRQGAEAEFATESDLPLIKEALGGSPATAVTAVGQAVYRVAAAPVGARAAVALGFPVDDAFAGALRDALGVDVTVVRGGEILATSLGAEERGLLSASAARKETGAGFGFGPLRADNFSLFGLVDLPLFATDAGAARARLLRVPGLEGADIVLSTSAVAGLAPIADGQKTTVLLTGVILVLGLLFTGLARSRGSSFDDDDVEGLADAVERAASGDSSARAAEFLPGDLGRVARAVNKLILKGKLAPMTAGPAAEAGGTEKAAAVAAADSFSFGAPESSAGPAAESEGLIGLKNPITSPFDSPFAAKEAEEPAPAPKPEQTPAPALQAFRDESAGPAFAFPPPPPPPPAAAVPAPSRQEAALAAAAAELQAVPLAPEPVRPAPPAPRPASLDPFAMVPENPELAPAAHSFLNPDATVVAAVPDALLKATTRAAPPSKPAPASPDDEQAHYEEVFRDFLATRERCGESVGALTFDKFAAKLHKNHEQLVAKYNCRTVRFTVYVKDGKAALKAAPIGTRARV